MTSSQHDTDAYVDLNGNAARAIAAATAQIDLALREANEPVDCLGRTLERISARMQELRQHFLQHADRCGDAHGMLEMDLAVEALSAEMAVAIQNMQFFDRMFQHLTHVHDYLTAGADNLGSYNKTPQSTRRWCKTCGGHVMSELPSLRLIDVYPALLKHLDFRPREHVHYQEAVLRIVDSLPKHKDLPKAAGGSGVLLPS